MSIQPGASLAVALLAALLAAPAPARAQSIRCDGGLVAVGDSKLDLLGKCGLPTLREEVPAVAGVFGSTGTARSLATQERWTYNFGPRSFVQHVTIEIGVVKAVERGSYGYELGQPRPAPARVPRARCEHPGGYRVGDFTFDVLARCGEPALREETAGQVAVEAPVGGGSWAPVGFATVRVEVWIYDFGPQAFSRRLEFEDGKLRRIIAGGYGYSRL